jgi:hypothetical protein
VVLVTPHIDMSDKDIFAGVTYKDVCGTHLNFLCLRMVEPSGP